MNLSEEYKKIYWEHNTKGKWNGMPVELLTDKHLMRIPNFIRKRFIEIRLEEGFVTDKKVPLFVVPKVIRKEIKRRNMILNDDFTVIKKEPKKPKELELPDSIKRLNRLDKPIINGWKK